MASNPPKLRIAPSLLAADPLRFGDEVRDVERAGADLHHVDVMDGHYVPNLTYGVPFVKALKKMAQIPLDVHIMVANPDAVAEQYIDAGADYLVFHPEASFHPYRLAQVIRARGAKAGVALNPGSSLEILWPLLEVLDIVNVMSVNPGFGGQLFLPSSVGRIKAIYQRLKDLGREGQVAIEVDGGINQDTGRLVVEAGANILVAGTYVFGAGDRARMITGLKALKG